MGFFPISNYARLDVVQAEKDPCDPAWLQSMGSPTPNCPLARTLCDVGSGAQTQEASTGEFAFEVVSVKPNTTLNPNISGNRTRGCNLDAVNTSVRAFITLPMTFPNSN